MQVTFFGAVREVTGSMHLITGETDRILLDCGLFQGNRKKAAVKNRTMPVDPKNISSLVLSHAHMDHSGRIPMLTKDGFQGNVVCTRATAAACRYLLLDSAHIQESDADYLNYKTARNALSAMDNASRKKGSGKSKRNNIRKQLKKPNHRLNTEKINELIEQHGLEAVRPLYTKVDAENALDYIHGTPYRHEVTVGKNATCKFYEAGHILGSAVSIVKIQEKGQTKTICYTGDIGRFDKPIIRDPVLSFEEQDRDIDLMIIESTYGNRQHDPVQDLKPRLKKVILDAVERGGAIIIPAFAFGRTQEIVYVLHELYNEGEVPRLPVHVDSPLATNITKVFGEHPEVYDEETHDTFLEKGKNPFSFSQINFVGSVEESMALNREEKPHIVIASAGMCEAGRVLHHLRHKIHNPKHTILIVGFMAMHTLGKKGWNMKRPAEKGMHPW